MAKQLAEMTLEELWQLFPIFLVPHDDGWAGMFEREKARLISFFPVRPIRISHIGSTAVAGIYAKPIVDIIVEVEREADLDKCADALRANEYILMSRQGERLSFNRGYTPEGFASEVFHLHLRRAGDNDELYFCDYLNAFPDVAKDYEKLKLSLCEKYRHDRDGYTMKKSDFVREATNKARALFGDRYARIDESFIY